LLDRVEAGDRRAVEAHPVVERVLYLARRDREALQVPFDVREPEEQEFDLLVPDPLQHVPPRLRIARRPRLALDLRHAPSSLQTRKPRALPAPEAPSPTNALSLQQPRPEAPRAPVRGRGGRSRARRGR